MANTSTLNSELIEKDPIEAGSFFANIRKHGAKRILEAQNSTSKFGVDAHLNTFDMDSFMDLLRQTNQLETFENTRRELKDKLDNIIES